MSVVINNMAMPQNCYECRFCETYLGHHLCAAFLNYIEDPRSGRLDTCPLEEQKHGKWEDVEEVLEEGITDGMPYTIMSVGYKCSECGNEMGNLWSFCPNCGARMEGSEDV